MSLLKEERQFIICAELIRNVKKYPKTPFFKIFDSKVQSILLYSSEILGLQRLHSKIYLRVPIKSPNIKCELGRYPLL